jgi:putative membrane protein
MAATSLVHSVLTAYADVIARPVADDHTASEGVSGTNAAATSMSTRKVHTMPPGMHEGHGLHGFQESSLAAVSFFGGFLLLLLLLAGLATLYLRRTGRLSLPALGHTARPEQEARRILAERFARGDITTDDFLERASILNWTPGVEPVRDRGRNRT